MKESPLFWPAHVKGDTLFVLDETLLPEKLHYIKVKNVREAVSVIRKMKTRAFGQFLVVMNTFLMELDNLNADGRRSNADNRGLKRKTHPRKSALDQIKKIADELNKSRPTFPFSEVTGMVVGWAQKALAEKKDIRTAVEKNIFGFLAGIRARRLGRVEEIARTIKDGDRVLTHCNVSGELAMAAQLCKAQKKNVRFYATETRPYFQGAKLTCWELKEAGADVTLVVDNSIGFLLNNHLVNLVITGSDRSCANGDIANKIGTYQIAVLAKEFGVPFYALTQPSNKIAKGEDIPIEIRGEDELLKFDGKRFAPAGVKGFYPGFDVVPHGLIKKPIALNVN